MTVRVTMCSPAHPHALMHTQHTRKYVASAGHVCELSCTRAWPEVRVRKFARMLPLFMHRALTNTQVNGNLASLSQLTALTYLYVFVLYFVCVSL